MFIEGTLNSMPNSTFRIEFFSNEEVDASGHGEGKLFLTSRVVHTNDDGDATFSVPYNDVKQPLLVDGGNVTYLTSTATVKVCESDDTPKNVCKFGSTSEFSEALAVDVEN